MIKPIATATAIGTQRELTLIGLSPGEYHFEVRASAAGGSVGDHRAGMSFRIRPPWFRTPLATACFTLLSLALLYGMYRRRVRLLRRHNIDLEANVAQQTRELTEERDKLTEANRLISKQADKLGELDRLKSRFFANISHEFRTPLQLILGPIEDALHGERPADQPGFRDSLLMMRRNGKRLLALINQMLDLSRLEAGRMHITLREDDLPPFLAGIVMSFQSLADSRGMQLTFHAEPSRFRGCFDADKLEKILANLLSNAFKFTADHGKIRVVFQVGSEDRYTLRVKDTGQGIRAEELDQLFQPYRQVTGITSRFGPGSGLGLPLCRELVQLLGGTIEVRSDAGFGSEFTVALPFSRDHWTADQRVVFEEQPPLPLEPEPQSDQGELQPQTTAKRDDVVNDQAPSILLVEDNDEVRAYIRGHLQNRYRLLGAADGTQGLALAREQLPDLIISDVMMPELNGYDLCRQVKRSEKLNHIPVILLTAKAAEDDKLAGLETGADDYIYKPFNGAELRARVENLIEVRRVLRRRFSGELTLRASKVTVKSADAVFLERCRQYVEANLTDPDFGVEALARHVNVGARHLHRRLRALVNLSSAAFIRSLRLQRAADLLEQRAGGVAEIAHWVGFNDVDYFSRLFRQAYGVPPSKYQAEVTVTATEQLSKSSE